MEWGQQLRKAEPCPRPSRVLSAFENDGTTDLLSFRVDGDGPSLVSS